MGNLFHKNLTGTDLHDPKEHSHDITGLSGGLWSVLYSDNNSIVTGLALGTSGLFLSSNGITTAPVWAVAAGGAGGDNLGNHEATQMLDMNTYKITGLGDPVAPQDAVTLTYGNSNYAPSGGFVNLSGDYETHQGSSISHHNPTGYETVSGDYLVTSGVIADYSVVSGDYSVHQGNINAHITNLTGITTRLHNDLGSIGVTDHHDPTGYESVSGDYLLTSGTVSDYITVSGDFSEVSGDYAAGGPGGATNITGLSGGLWSVFYSDDSQVITGLRLGSSGLQLTSLGANTAPIWDLAGGAGGADNLGNHTADQILDMATYKITGLGDPIAAQDAASRKWTIDWTSGVSGDYAATSGTVDGYAAHVANVSAHIDPTGYESISGNYITHAASSISHHDPSGYETISGNYLTHVASSTSHHDPTGYESISGDYLVTSGTVSDYVVFSGDYSTHQDNTDAHHNQSHDNTDHSVQYAIESGLHTRLHHMTGTVDHTGTAWRMFYGNAQGTLTELALGASGLQLSSVGVSSAPIWSAAGGGPGGGATNITGLSGGAWSVFYSAADEVITGLSFGASGFVLSSMGATAAPVWASKAAGGGDDLGSHEATQMLDMNTFKITGLGDPAAPQDGATKIFVDNHNWLEADITDLDSTGYETISGAYLTHAASSTSHHDPSGYETVSGDYLVTSGAYVSHIASAISHHDPSGYETISGAYLTHAASSISHHDPSGYETVSGAYITHAASSTSHHDPSGYETVSGDYLVTSGAYVSHIASSTSHHNPSGYESISGDYLTHIASSIVHHDPSGYETVSGDYLTHIASSISHHDPSGYETISGDYLLTSGTVSDYVVVSGVAATALQNIVEDLTPQLGGDLDGNFYSVQLRTGIATDHKYNGIIISGIVDVNTVGFGGLLYIASDGHFEDANANSGLTSLPCRAMAMQAGVATVTVLTYGYVRDDSWSFTAGNNLYVQTGAGVITDVMPSGSNHQVQRVGFAISANEIMFNPSPDVIEWIT